MTWAVPEMLFLGANTALLTGIFFRLGGLTKGHEEHARRLGSIESIMQAKMEA